MTFADFLPYLFTAAASLGGSWVAITAALRVHAWRLDEQKSMLISHSTKHESHETRLTYLEAFHGLKKDK